MLKKFLGKDKENYQTLLQQTDRLLQPEERELIIGSILENQKFSPRTLVDMFSRLYLIKNPRIKAEKLKLIEELLIKKRVKGTCKGIIEKLREMVDPIAKQTMFKILQELAEDDDIPVLVPLLTAEDSETRRMVFVILHSLNHGTTSRLLVEELSKAHWTHKSEALNLLYEIGRIECISICRKLMQEGSEQDRKHAISILERLGSAEAVNVLSVAIDHEESPRIRFQIAKGLQAIENEAKVPALIKLLTDPKKEIIMVAMEGLDGAQSAKALPEMRKLVEHTELAIQLKALEVIGNLGNENDAEVLLPVLKDDNLRVRQAAVDALYALAFNTNTNISKVLMELMADRDVNVRRCVADILSRIQDESIFDRMFEFLRDEDWWVREAIAETLSKIKDERVVPSAINLLSSSDEGLRRYGVEILIGIKDQRAVQPIMKLLNDPDWWVRERAVEALGYLGDPKVVPLLVNMLNVKELLYVSAKALGELMDPRAIEPLLKKLETSRSDVKIVILESLAKLDAASAIGQIKNMLIDPDKEVRNKARDVLRRLGAELGDALSIADRWWEKQNLSQLDSLLLEAKLQGGTDLLLVTDTKPLIRLHGNLRPFREQQLTQQDIWDMLLPILSKTQEDSFKNHMDLDFSYEIPGEGRFRGNAFVQLNGINVVLHVIPDIIPSIEELRLPAIVYDLAKIKQGMVLFTGPASCGKTTSLAALTNLIIDSRHDHIITVEDPIEYLYPSDRSSVVTQREVGRHTQNFPSAVRAALREDPDIIVIGEMRDHETISMSITAAETGHLVLATVHSISAPKTLDRIIDIFPTIQQDQIRLMLAESLRAVISQQLVTKKEGNGRVAAFEILVVTPAISNLIREGKVFQIPGIMTTSRQHGMQTMDQALADLVRGGLISPEEALAKAFNPDEFMEYVAVEQGHGYGEN